MKKDLQSIIEECGKVILNYYGDTGFTQKDDASPLTIADQKSHDFLIQNLPDIKNIPILSEENPIDFSVRQRWETFWLIDPLDGTKEFIHGMDEFSINIALIQNSRPVIGVIYAPVLKELYYAEKHKGFSYHGPHYENHKQNKTVIAVSRFHHSAITDDFLQKNDFTNTLAIGAALKFGRLATGQVDIYPRFEGSKEWDIAAGHLIVQEAKGSIVDLTTNEAPLYNKPDIRNNYFIAARSQIDIEKLSYPEGL